MSQYLLLRDNKQSGPYSLDEIVAKGFKPYDLIWIEGKSAGWRYPSELPEFKSLAPAVEEQPFDRFFKKPVSLSDNASSAEQPVIVQAITQPTPVSVIPAEEPKRARIQPRKIFVTFPESIGSRERAESIRPEENIPALKEDSMPAQLPQDKKPAVVLDGYSGSSDKEKQTLLDRLQAELESRKSPETKPAQTDLNKGRYAKVSFAAETPEEKIYVPRRTASKRTRGNLVTKIAVATCLLLGGIIIGLLISGNRQSIRRDQLDSIVKQIQQKQTNDQAAAKKEETPPVQPESQAPATVQQAVPGNGDLVNNPEKDKDNSLAAVKHTSDQKAIVDRKADKTGVSNTSISNSGPSPAEPPVLGKNSPELTSPDEGAKENARKSIFKMVDLENNEYKVGMLGGISNLELTVSNNSLYPIDQVEVQVNYLGPEKKIVKQQTILINDVLPGGQKTVAVPKSNRGVSITYTIKKINSKALGLASSGI